VLFSTSAFLCIGISLYCRFTYPKQLFNAQTALPIKERKCEYANISFKKDRSSARRRPAHRVRTDTQKRKGLKQLASRAEQQLEK
jgi:hypothetical protein